MHKTVHRTSRGVWVLIKNDTSSQDRPHCWTPDKRRQSNITQDNKDLLNIYSTSGTDYENQLNNILQ